MRPAIDRISSASMTKSLNEAIELLRALPDEEREAAVQVLFAYISNDDRECVVDDTCHDVPGRQTNE